MQMLYIWILAAVVFGVLEGITAQLVSIWFVLGAVAAAVAAACGGAVWLQGVLFVAVSVVALLATFGVLLSLGMSIHVLTMFG